MNIPASVMLSLVIAFIAGAPAAAGTLTGEARIIDGDTIDVAGTRIRLEGIDAPEDGQLCISGKQSLYNCGALASATLDAKIGGVAVRCEGSRQDRYGRLLATCFSEGININAWLVEEGWAVAFVRYSRAYLGEEERARAGLRGMWRGAFVAPWDWRHRGVHTEIRGALHVPIESQHLLLPKDD